MPLGTGPDAQEPPPGHQSRPGGPRPVGSRPGVSRPTHQCPQPTAVAPRAGQKQAGLCLGLAAAPLSWAVSWTLTLWPSPGGQGLSHTLHWPKPQAAGPCEDYGPGSLFHVRLEDPHRHGAPGWPASKDSEGPGHKPVFTGQSCSHGPRSCSVTTGETGRRPGGRSRGPGASAPAPGPALGCSAHSRRVRSAPPGRHRPPVTPRTLGVPLLQATLHLRAKASQMLAFGPQMSLYFP